MRIKINCLFWSLAVCSTLSATAAQAALYAVSGLQAGEPPALTEVLADGDPAQVAVSLANGFPLWYQDVEDGLKLQLCLDTQLVVAPGVVVNPCEYEPPALGAPPSFPGNFGAEAMYWNAATFGNYVSSNGATSSALLVLALEATGANEAALNDGNQAAFTRIRLRIDLPVAGTYRVTHPSGSRDYVIATPGIRAINQTQDFGIALAQDFLVAMRNAATPPVEPAPFIPSINAGIVNQDGATVGPFLVPLNPHGGIFDPADPETFTGGPVTVDGVTYIGLPFAPNPTNPALPIEVFQPVTGSTFIPEGETEPANYFRIELITDALGNPPGVDGSFSGFFLNAADESQVVQFDEFLLVGKLFDDAANLEPVANDDLVGTATGNSVNIDVAGNDFDVTEEDADINFHEINFQALAPADADGPVLNANGMPVLTATLPTAAGGTVRRVTSIPTGRTTFLYTPPLTGFAGPDSFRYVVQDHGGLISAPATVDIIVEDLRVARADYRPRFGKWQLQGTSSDDSDNSVVLYGSPRAQLTPDQEVQTPPVTSEARGFSILRASTTAIEFLLKVDPLPVTAITAAHIHVGAAGENGPIIFSLYESAFGIPFASPRSGLLTPANLQVRPEAGISSFADALEAIRAGNAYVNVHTAAFPAGEIRGQLGQPVIGTAAVVDGAWQFNGRSPVSPGALPSVSVESANEVRLLGVPLRLR